MYAGKQVGGGGERHPPQARGPEPACRGRWRCARQARNACPRQCAGRQVCAGWCAVVMWKAVRAESGGTGV